MAFDISKAMAFDASKALDEAGAADLDAAPGRQIPGAAASTVGRNAFGSLLAGRNGAPGGSGIAGMMAATLPAMGQNSPFLRAATGAPAPDTLEVLLGGAAFRGIFAPGHNPLLETTAKFGSLAAGSRAGVANAAPLGGIADGLRNLGSSKDPAVPWRSTYGGAPGNPATRHAASMYRPLADQYAGGLTQIMKPLDIQPATAGSQVVQGFLRAYEPRLEASLDALNRPLFDAVGRFAAGFTTFAQRIGEWLRRVILRPFEEIFERLRREMERWPRDPYGEPVPFWNVRLYRLARAAYEGDYVARARFLDEIGADGSPDNVLMIGELLKPTFDPQRLDLRVDWERMDSAFARRWLGRRLEGLKLSAWKEEQKRKNGERPYEAEVEGQIVQAISSDVPELELVEFELREDERALYERLRGVLPEQQYWFCWYRAHGLKYEEIAAKMGIALGTVKTHARLVKRNPRLLEAVGR